MTNADEMWAAVDAIERAAWARSWMGLRAAQERLVGLIGVCTITRQTQITRFQRHLEGDPPVGGGGA